MSAPLFLVIDKASPVPIYHQLAQALEEAIRNGTLASGSRLEKETQLAARLHVSRGTVSRALNQLVATGLVVRTRRAGVYVADTEQLAHPRQLIAPILRNRKPNKPQE